MNETIVRLLWLAVLMAVAMSVVLSSDLYRD